MNAALTKLVQELLNAIQQTRQAQEATQELADGIKQDGIPELELPEYHHDMDSVYRGYELQAQIQQLRATHEDALELVNELVGLVLFIKSRVLAAHSNQEQENNTLISGYEAQIATIKARYSEIEASKRLVIADLERKQALLKKMSTVI